VSKYGTAAKFRAFALRDEAVAGYTDDQLDAFITSASAEADTYIASRYLQDGPLATWGPELEKAVFKIARLELLEQRGVDASNPADEMLVKSYDDAIRWLRDVQASRASLVVVSTSPAASTMPRVYSQPRRNW
jgi:phage gp36-like protein